MTPLLTYLVETGDLNAQERAHLRRLLDDDRPERSARTLKRKSKS
jgi:hypothetical protein